MPFRTPLWTNFVHRRIRGRSFSCLAPLLGLGMIFLILTLIIIFLNSMLGLYRFSIGIEWKLNIVSPHPRGFKRSGVVFFDNKTRTLRGQKGMVDAGASYRAANPAQFWIRSARWSRHNGPIWPWSSSSRYSILKLEPFSPVGTVPLRGEITNGCTVGYFCTLVILPLLESQIFRLYNWINEAIEIIKIVFIARKPGNDACSSSFDLSLSGVVMFVW